MFFLILISIIQSVLYTLKIFDSLYKTHCINNIIKHMYDIIMIINQNNLYKNPILFM